MMYSAFLCFAVVLPSLLFIFGVEPGVVAIVLALSGAGFVFSGVKVNTLVLPIIGLVLQFLAVFLFADTVWYPFGATILLNNYFLSCCCFVLVAFFSAYLLDKGAVSDVEVACRRHFYNRYLLLLFFFLGAAVWFVAGLREIWMHIVVSERLNGTLLFISATSILSGLLAEKVRWNRLDYILCLHLPALWLLMVLELLRSDLTVQLISGWGAVAWGAAFFVQYRILALWDAREGSGKTKFFHLFSLWALLLVVQREMVSGLLTLAGSANFGPVAGKLFFSCLYFLLLFVMRKKNCWPVRQHTRVYLWGGVAFFVISMITVL
jgi:hypothetical protein